MTPNYPTENRAKRVLIVDDQNIFASGLKSLLQAINDVEVVSIIKSGTCVHAALQKFQPDVLLLDLDLPGQNGLQVLKSIRHKFPKLVIAIVTMHTHQKLVRQARDFGANAFLNKDASSIELKSVIFSTPDEPFFTSKCLEHTLEPKPTSNSCTTKWMLTRRELDVIRLICGGKNNEEISSSLFISIETVKTHRKNIFRKLKLNKASELVRYAYDNALI